MNDQFNIARLQVQAITAHKSNYPNPISFAIGEKVQVGKRDTQYPGWIWTTTTDGNSGWAPEQLLDIDGATAVARTPYNATELETAVGETLTVIDALNGWYLVSNTAQQSGWVPAETVKIYQSESTP